jgi:methylphosphotriester-DNA--protein-cysteine methyltransferase
VLGTELRLLRKPFACIKASPSLKNRLRALSNFGLTKIKFSRRKETIFGLGLVEILRAKRSRTIPECLRNGAG